MGYIAFLLKVVILKYLAVDKISLQRLYLKRLCRILYKKYEKRF